ncbi:MAG TPA: alpha/beta hydrolase [Burkholderiales bacterium]|nr:alpha/beta hydrolase [Burkholderiales bacterium]
MVNAGLIAGAANAAPEPMWIPAAIPSQVPVQEGMVEVDGSRLWYWDTGGAGHPVILLHAGTQSGAGWVYQQPVFARAGYRVIGYSRRGYYRSDAGDADNPGVGSDDLHHLIKHLKLGAVDLIAAAQGGFFAVDYTLAWPDKVRSLAVVSSYMGIADADYVAVNTRLRPTFFATLPHDFQELSPSYRAGNPEGLDAWRALEKQAIPGKRITPGMQQPLTWVRLESIKHPALLMTGDSDLYTPPSLLRMQAQHMPHAEVHIVREAGHSPYWEQPAIFNEILLAFLAKQKK